jgi:hypothetical protein
MTGEMLGTNLGIYVALLLARRVYTSSQESLLCQYSTTLAFKEF